MANYKEMYLKMMRASEEALRILIQAQQECEEALVSYGSPQGVNFLRDDSIRSIGIIPQTSGSES